MCVCVGLLSAVVSVVSSAFGVLSSIECIPSLLSVPVWIHTCKSGLRNELNLHPGSSVRSCDDRGCLLQNHFVDQRGDLTVGTLRSLQLLEASLDAFASLL